MRPNPSGSSPEVCWAACCKDCFCNLGWADASDYAIFGVERQENSAHCDKQLYNSSSFVGM